LLLLAFSSYASSAVLTFEDLVDGTSVGTAYPGLTFQNAGILTSGLSLNESEFPPRSGGNVVFDDGGPIVVRFSSAASAVSLYITYSETITAIALDAKGAIADSAVSLYNNNLALSGDVSSHPNELFKLSAASIESVRIAGSASGFSFALDDFTFVTDSSSAPEASTGELFLLSCLILSSIVFLRRKAKRAAPVRWLYECAPAIPGAIMRSSSTLASMRSTLGPRLPFVFTSLSFTLVVTSLALNAQKRDLGPVYLAPAIVVAGTPRTVTASITLQDPALIDVAINLIRIDSSGKPLNIIGALHDDGKDGDLTARDHVYSVTFSINEPASEKAYFKVSAAFTGQLQRSWSETVFLDITTAGSRAASLA